MIHWQKSSYSGGADGHECVELGRTPTTLLVRESDDPARALAPTPAALAALLSHLREA